MPNGARMGMMSRKIPNTPIDGNRAQARRQKKGQGAMPLAESRGGASGGVWGNAPTVFRVLTQREQPTKAQAAKRPCQ